jgi:NADPH-dependent 7-cyano-7-deazaguanine reductase QueF
MIIYIISAIKLLCLVTLSPDMAKIAIKDIIKC